MIGCAQFQENLEMSASRRCNELSRDLAAQMWQTASLLAAVRQMDLPAELYRRNPSNNSSSSNNKTKQNNDDNDNNDDDDYDNDDNNNIINEAERNEATVLWKV